MAENRVVKYRTFKSSVEFVDWQEDQLVNPEFAVISVSPLFSDLKMGFEEQGVSGGTVGNANVNLGDVSVFVLYMN